MQFLESFVVSLPSTIEQGLIYAVLALGILITYTILNFPDLTVDGSFPMGGAISISLILAGWQPLPALAIAALAAQLPSCAQG